MDQPVAGLRRDPCCYEEICHHILIVARYRAQRGEIREEKWPEFTGVARENTRKSRDLMTQGQMIAAWIAVLNLVAFAAMGFDKQLARSRSSRIPEAWLLWLAFLGGSPGAIFAQQWIRHRTVKEPFRSLLYGITVLQVAAAIVFLANPEWVWTLLQ